MSLWRTYRQVIPPAVCSGGKSPSPKKTISTTFGGLSLTLSLLSIRSIRLSIGFIVLPFNKSLDGCFDMFRQVRPSGDHGGKFGVFFRFRCSGCAAFCTSPCRNRRFYPIRAVGSSPIPPIFERPFSTVTALWDISQSSQYYLYSSGRSTSHALYLRKISRSKHQ